MSTLALYQTAAAHPNFKRLWWQGDQAPFGEYNYSETVDSGGSYVNKANEWGDLVIGTYLTGPSGRSESRAIDLQFSHNGSGLAMAKLTSSSNGNGQEPSGFNDRDAPKYIPAKNVDLHFAAYCPNCQSLKIQLEDTRGNVSQSISIDDYISPYGRYALSYVIPVEDFQSSSNFRLDHLRSVNIFIDEAIPSGHYQMGIVHMGFHGRPSSLK